MFFLNQNLFHKGVFYLLGVIWLSYFTYGRFYLYIFLFGQDYLARFYYENISVSEMENKTNSKLIEFLDPTKELILEKVKPFVGNVFKSNLSFFSRFWGEVHNGDYQVGVFGKITPLSDKNSFTFLLSGFSSEGNINKFYTIPFILKSNYLCENLLKKFNDPYKIKRSLLGLHSGKLEKRDDEFTSKSLFEVLSCGNHDDWFVDSLKKYNDFSISLERGNKQNSMGNVLKSLQDWIYFHFNGFFEINLNVNQNCSYCLFGKYNTGNFRVDVVTKEYFEKYAERDSFVKLNKYDSSKFIISLKTDRKSLLKDNLERGTRDFERFLKIKDSFIERGFNLK